MTAKQLVLADYSPRWPGMFQEERARILRAIGERLIAIEHIGSTSIPGLAAKPVIDIMALVADESAADACIEPLKPLGYQRILFPHNPSFDVVNKRRFLRDGPEGEAPHHIHITCLGSDFWERHLLFRDHLRAHADTARQYEALKRSLIEKYGRDQATWGDYSDSKGPFIEDVIAQARAEKQRKAKEPSS